MLMQESNRDDDDEENDDLENCLQRPLDDDDMKLEPAVTLSLRNAIILTTVVTVSHLNSLYNLSIFWG